MRKIALILFSFIVFILIIVLALVYRPPLYRTSMLTLTSSAFKQNSPIPSQYTCDGMGISPPLEISGVPAEALSLALIVDDPDAPSGTFDHWIAWNIPATTTEIAEGSAPAGISGVNGAGTMGYTPACPPSGLHHYHFKLYALDTMLSLPAGSEGETLETAMTGHVLEETELIGLYERQNE